MRTTRGSRSWSSADRKSTRLNSSHVESSYAVFCSKKKAEHEGHLPGQVRGGEAGVVQVELHLQLAPGGGRRRVPQPVRHEAVAEPAPDVLQAVEAPVLRLPPGLERPPVVGAVEVSRVEQLQLADHPGEGRPRRRGDRLAAEGREAAVVSSLLDPAPTDTYTLSLHDALPI